MPLRRLGQRGRVKGQQIERTVDLRQVLPGDGERACGGVDGAMAKEELESRQVHTRFQQMRGTAVALIQSSG